MFVQAANRSPFFLSCEEKNQQFIYFFLVFVLSFQILFVSLQCKQTKELLTLILMIWKLK